MGYKLPFYHHRPKRNPVSSAPYLTGDTFRSVCDHVFDDEKILLDPSQIKDGDTVFVRGKYVTIFFAVYFQKIKARFILVSHNTDCSLPRESFPFLKDEKIIAWFTQNADRFHEKLHLLPIGLANQDWTNGNIEMLKQELSCKREKKHLLLMNFFTASYPPEREFVYKHFKKIPFCKVKGQKDYPPYLKDIAESKFVLSPRGQGIDCFRTWESLYLGAYPVVKSSTLNPLYENLPVLVIKEWSEVNEKLLHKTYDEFQKKTFDLSKLTFDYWWNQIRVAQELRIGR